MRFLWTIETRGWVWINTPSFEGTEFTEFVDTIKKESIFSLDTPVSQEDTILTLVTCNYDVNDGRLFIHAVEVTE